MNNPNTNATNNNESKLLETDSFCKGEKDVFVDDFVNDFVNDFVKGFVNDFVNDLVNNFVNTKVNNSSKRLSPILHVKI